MYFECFPTGLCVRVFLTFVVTSLAESQAGLPITSGACFSCFPAQHNFAVVARTSRATAANKRVVGYCRMDCGLRVFARKRSLLEPVSLTPWRLWNWPCKDCLLVHHIFLICDALSLLRRFVFYCRSWHGIAKRNLSKSGAFESWLSIYARVGCLYAECLPQSQSK